MAITRTDPNTIFLGGERVQVGDLAVSEVLTPGMGVERFNNAGVVRWRKATADAAGPAAVITNQSMMNKGVNDTYPIGDLAEVSILYPGATAWMLIASGQSIAAGDKLGNAGDGTLKKNATVNLYTALENKPTVQAATRIRVEAL
ncbi:MAG: hypothetical protein ACHQX3_00275 [Nitrospirales bacterium]